MNYNGKYAFISGIPAAGKSFLAEKVAVQLGISHVDVDMWRDEMRNDAQLRQWTDFYWNKNEEQYWQTTHCDEQWENLQKQSEAFWPEILKRINETMKQGTSAIFEAVNILPHLAAKDLSFPGVALLGSSFEEIFERNKKAPRWGKTEALQKMEAEAFFYCEREKYKEEAEKYGYPVFTDAKEAEKYLLKILS